MLERHCYSFLPTTLIVGLFSISSLAQEPDPVPSETLEQVEPEPEPEPKPESEPEPESESESEPEPEPEPEPKKEAVWTDFIKVKGDLRYRFEMIQKGDADLRYRHRVRARPALEAKVFDDLSATIGLGTGGADGSDGDGDPVSNNQTLGSGFSSKFIWLDLAYFDYHPSWFKGFSVKGGKMKNPLYRVGKSELLWDPDLNPEGMSLSYKRKFGIAEPFLHGVGYFMEERKEDDDTWLLGVQAGLKLHFTDAFYALLGGRYMDYTHIENQELIWDNTDAFGNAQVDGPDDDRDGVPDAQLYANDYNEVGGFVEVGGKIVKLPWAVFGDFATNTAVGENKNGWLAGALVGSTKEQWNFKLRYIYRIIESDSVYGLLSDSDFNGGDTNGKGHEINFSLALHKRVQFATTYFFNQPFDTVLSGGNYDYHRVQIDLKMKF